MSPVGKQKRQLHDNKENEQAVKKQLRNSTSIASLRSFVRMRRNSYNEQIPVISQPTLNESSREKVRNKIRQSPSMLSVGLSVNAELCSEIESRLTSELVQLSISGTLEPKYFPDLTDSLKKYKFVDLSKSTLEETLKTVRIHRIMKNIDGICPILDVHVVPAPLSQGQLTCVIEMPHLGTRLDRFHFESHQEAYHVFIRIVEILAEAERQFEFEHRNLHPGNIVIERNPSNGMISNVSILNCKLSRIRAPNTILYSALDHPDFYKAKLPVLHRMRRTVADPVAFQPVTNVLWLAFLARYLNNIKPGMKLKRTIEVLSAKWTLRNPPKSATDALVRINKVGQK